MLLPETLKIHDQQKFEFHYIYFLPWKNQMVENLNVNGGKVICFRASNNILLILKAWSIARYIRDHNIQIVHAHLPWAGVVARIAGKITGIPVIYTEHNKQERYHRVTRLLNLTTMNWLSQIIAVSSDVAVSLKKYKPRLQPPLHIILNGVNLTHFSPGSSNGKKIREELKIPDAAPVIGTVAVFRVQKRLDVWMDVARKILDQIPTAHFIIVGDGPLKALLIEKRRELKLESRVHLVGLQTDVRPYLAAFDVYMMSSIFEGLPIALLEAMACGRPIVSTDAGGIKEVVRHDKEGLLCAVDHPERLVELALDVCASESKRASLGLQGRKRIEENFSLSSMVRALEKVYLSFHSQPR